MRTPQLAFITAAHPAFLGVAALNDVVGRTVFDFYSQDQAVALQADDTCVLASEKPILNREDVLTDRGRKTRALTSKIPYRDEAYTIAGLVCISHILEDRK
jgi:PAS fold